MNIALFTVLAFLGFSASMTAGALAQAAAAPTETDLLQSALDAFRSGHVALASMTALVLISSMLSRFGAGKIPWLASSAGRATLLLIGAFGSAMAASLAAGGALSAAMVIAGLKVAVAAAGGYSLIKALIVEPLSPYIAKSPVWLRLPFSMLGWVFSKPAAIAKAEQAGEAAVAAHKQTNQIEFEELK